MTPSLRRALAALAVLLGAALLGAAAAQTVDGRRDGGSEFYALDDLARALGVSVAPGVGSVTVRTPDGVLTVFADSPDALWQPAGVPGPEGVASFAPPLVEDGRWFLPADLLDPLGARAEGGEVVLADGRRLPARFPAPAVIAATSAAEVVDLGYGVPGLRFYAAGPAGDETVSLLLVDLGLLSLVFPEERARLDGFVAGLDADKPLYVLVTALAEGAWESALEFSQGAQRLEVRYPFRLRLLDGDPARVGPNLPVAGLVLLPDRFNLREPLTVRWGGVSATVTFRR